MTWHAPKARTKEEEEAEMDRAAESLTNVTGMAKSDCRRLAEMFDGDTNKAATFFFNEGAEKFLAKVKEEDEAKAKVEAEEKKKKAEEEAEKEEEGKKEGSAGETKEDVAADEAAKQVAEAATSAMKAQAKEAEARKEREAAALEAQKTFFVILSLDEAASLRRAMQGQSPAAVALRKRIALHTPEGRELTVSDVDLNADADGDYEQKGEEKEQERKELSARVTKLVSELTSADDKLTTNEAASKALTMARAERSQTKTVASGDGAIVVGKERGGRLQRRTTNDILDRARNPRAFDLASQSARFFDGDLWYNDDEVIFVLTGLEADAESQRRLAFEATNECRLRDRTDWEGTSIAHVFHYSNASQLLRLRVVTVQIQRRLSKSFDSMTAAFQKFDLDGTGFLTLQELTLALKALPGLEGEITDADCVALMSHFDNNNDGFLDYREFASSFASFAASVGEAAAAGGVGQSGPAWERLIVSRALRLYGQRLRRGCCDAASRCGVKAKANGNILRDLEASAHKAKDNMPPSMASLGQQLSNVFMGGGEFKGSGWRQSAEQLETHASLRSSPRKLYRRACCYRWNGKQSAAPRGAHGNPRRLDRGQVCSHLLWQQRFDPHQQRQPDLDGSRDEAECRPPWRSPRARLWSLLLRGNCRDSWKRLRRIWRRSLHWRQPQGQGCRRRCP